VSGFTSVRIHLCQDSPVRIHLCQDSRVGIHLLCAVEDLLGEELQQPSLPEYVCHIRKVFQIRKVFHSRKVFPI
jgi:hypothetical protein